MATGGVASFEALRFAPSSVPSYSKCLPSPKRMINRCSDFIYRAPVSLIKKPCYDRIYGLSRTMRCFMIQGGFMLMIRSGLPSGPLSGHLFVPPAPAALDTPIFLAPRPIHRLLVHLHFEIVTSRRLCAGKTAGTEFDTYGSLWKRTDSGMEKGRGRSDGLGEGETFLESSPSPNASRRFQRSSVLYPVRRRPDALPPSRIPTHTDCSYNQYKRHNKATVPPRTASRFSLASS